MLSHNTVTTLRTLRLAGMANAFEEQLTQPATQSLSFEERLGLLVDRERTHRDNARLARLLKVARLKHASACVENIDYRAGRGLEKRRWPAWRAVTGFATITACSLPAPRAGARRG